MKRNKKQNIKLAALILILLLGIGFAALAANLKIDGTVNVAKTSWDVHFENVSITEGSVTANPAPTSDDATTTEMAYTINFTKPGDYFEFTVDIVNAGTIDAMVDVVSNNAYADASSTTPITLPTYLSSTVTYYDGMAIQPNQLLAHNTSEKIKVRVEFKKDIEISDLPSDGNISIVFKFIGDYKQADENAINLNSWIFPTGKTKDNLEVGDEICIRNQCFNFLHYDGTNNEDIVMLAKYNLNVGTNAKAPETGLQDSDVRGYKTGFTTYGTVGFSYVDYWTENNTVKSKYGNDWYDNDIYDTNYNFGPNTVLHYVENYKTKLTDDYHVTIKKIRLLTYNETTDTGIGCTQGSCPADSFIANTSFWYGSVKEADTVLALYGTNVGTWNRTTDGYLGVRPVVVIAKENI